jgi:GxxExxY protein
MDMAADQAGKDKVLYRELSYGIVGCAQRVHAALGPGFPEKVHQRALTLEMAKAGLCFQAENPFEVMYDGVNCGDFRADFVVDGCVILELKAVECLVDEHIAQAVAYLKATGLRLAILINFGARKLETRRVVL